MNTSKRKFTDIKLSKQFWALCYECFNSPYSNTQGYFLVECDSALNLDNYLSQRSEDAGESMGSIVFRVEALYTSWDLHQSNVNYEAEAKSSAEVLR